MNKFKKPIGTRKKQSDIETLQQARGRAVDAAAKFRLIAETALVALLPTLDVSHCDAEDLQAIQSFLEETGHLNEMKEADPLNLIRSLLESTDSEELHYIRAAHEAAAFMRQLEVEKLRLLAVTELLKRKGSVSSKFRIEQLKAVNAQMGWMLDNTPYQSFSDFLSVAHCIPQSEISREIIRQQQINQGKETTADDAQNQTAEMPGV